MRLISIGVFVLFSFKSYSQTYIKPWEEADKALAFVDNEKERFDSLRKNFKGHWTLDFTLGTRFLINSKTTSLQIDTITNVDFTRNKTFFGLGSSYFINDQWSVGFGLGFTPIPKQQEITNISFGSNGPTGQGKGNGGAVLNFGLGTRYYLRDPAFFRPYLGINLGTTHLIAIGGSANFSLQSGRNEEITTRRAVLPTAQVQVGFGYRISPGTSVDFNLGLSRTSTTRPIGNVTSFGGISTSLTLQFILNRKK